ncbi:MAG: hypothetical protein H7062_12830 [Candidatus Saccharimonas sp.]|nr:hypothetical protein [Planctomycetaceae bacterium]
MSLSVTLNIYSGRPNPVWTLEDDQAEELMKLLSEGGEPTNLKSSAGLVPLGYRGFHVTSTAASPFGALSLHAHDGIIDPGPTELNLISGKRAVESFLLETAGAAIDKDVKKHINDSLKAKKPMELKDFVAAAAAAVACPLCKAADAPIYNPGIWNTPSVQPFNNCYNYANDQRTNTFAQPGRAHGKPITKLSCSGTQPSAVADGLVPTANFSGTLKPGQGWYVALVIWPNVDYHWYRQDKVGCWSHKPGSTAARNKDNSGNAISDPRTCNRGPYSSFCTFMKTKRGLVIR